MSSTDVGAMTGGKYERPPTHKSQKGSLALLRSKVVAASTRNSKQCMAASRVADGGLGGVGPDPTNHLMAWCTPCKYFGAVAGLSIWCLDFHMYVCMGRIRDQTITPPRLFSAISHASKATPEVRPSTTRTRPSPRPAATRHLLPCARGVRTMDDGFVPRGAERSSNSMPCLGKESKAGL